MVKKSNTDKPTLSSSSTQEINILQRITLERGELKLFSRSVDYGIFYLYLTVLGFGVSDLVSRLINRMDYYMVG
ncbi:MAG: hypothetical protein LZ168_05440 [Thaumarchaeota archaeon]|jgi:hypothetical protein|nr:hypothetical protein [Candidatus Geocrenenecus arthurdayi]